MSEGIFFAVSTGAGNHSMITLEAINVLKKCHAIFYPKSERNTISIDSLSDFDFTDKTLVPCLFKMTKDKKESTLEYEVILEKILAFLREGKTVAMISLGDVSLYSSSSRMTQLIEKSGYKVRFVSGVNSYSAAACAAKIPLCEQDEMMSVIPADAFFCKGKLKSQLENEGTKILMKMSSHLKEIINLLNEMSLISTSTLVQRASMENEKIFYGNEILKMTEEDFKYAYLSIIIVK